MDDYRELVLDGTAANGLAEALMELTQETHRNRRRLLPEQRPVVELPRSRGGATREEARRQAEGAVQEIEEDMKRLGIPPPTHYYRAIERSETGEIDRTHGLGRPLRSRRRRTSE